jgi:hypothetical protein
VSDCCLTHNEQFYHGENNFIQLIYGNVTCSRHDKAVHCVLNNNHSHNLIPLIYGNVTCSRHDKAVHYGCLTHNEQLYHGENKLHLHITVE